MNRPPLSAARGYLFIVVAVLFWGSSASLAKFLFLTRFDTVIVTQMRSSLSFILLAVYFGVRDRSVFRIEKKDVVKFALAGVVGIALTQFTYYFTIKEATVATAILLQNTAPVLVMLYTVAVTREESLNGPKVFALALALAGCYFAVSGGSIASIHLAGWPLVTGITSSLTYAFMLLVGKHLVRKYPTWTVLLHIFGYSTLFWLLINNPWQIAARGYSWQDWGILWFFAIVSVLIPYVMFISGLRILDASTVGILTILEPVIAILVAYFTLGESLGPVQVAGAIAVVSALVLLQLRALRDVRLRRETIHAG